MGRESKIDQAADALLDADSELARAAAQQRDNPAAKALGWASDIGDQPQMRILSALVIGGGLLAGNARLVRAGLRMLVAHEAATFAKDQVKTRIDRTRPRSAQSKQDRKTKRGSSTAKEESSFPSGHSAGSMAVARAFVREFPEYRLPALGAATVVAAAQIPRCAHYGSDVAVGMVLGAAAEAVTNRAWERLEDAIAQPHEAR